MDDDDFGADPEFLAALAAADVAKPAQPATAPPRQQQPPPPQPQPQPRPGQQPAVAHRPTPPRIQQPTPQRMERPGIGASASASAGTRIVQPTPQALPGPPGTGGGGGGGGDGPGPGRPPMPSTGSSILVSPRQKNNPVLSQLRSVAWEYSDIVADYGLGTTTCALFLSLKYHRLHPEYIYARIQGLQGKYQLRILLTLVDIDNHEEPLRELAKTSLVNQVTLVLCWSAAEAARYLELYKASEHATGFAAIRGQQAAGYVERLVQFATVPRAINKADAVALVSAFGSVRRAVLAEPEQLALVSGWGEKKVQGWRRAVEAPFRVQKAKARRGRGRQGGQATKSTQAAGQAATQSTQATQAAEQVTETGTAGTQAGTQKGKAKPPEKPLEKPLEKPPEPPSERPEAELTDGVAAALAKLRQNG